MATLRVELACRCGHLAEEAARRWVAGCSDQERGWVPRRGLESWLGLMHEVRVLRLPAAFGRAHAGITLSENDGALDGKVPRRPARTTAPSRPRRAGR